ncbi:hypothetical protein [Aurantimonas aggregata]|nr:hypothetical protein [Aurantimonas aggregata]
MAGFGSPALAGGAVMATRRIKLDDKDDLEMPGAMRVAEAAE